MARNNQTRSQQKRNAALLEDMGAEEVRSSPQGKKKSRWNQNQCQGLFDFKPTKWQEQFLEVIANNKISATDSVAGCGKSATALYYACKEYLTDPTKKIVYVRTPVEAGMDQIGFLPGAATLSEKLGPHFESAQILIEQFIGKEKFQADLGSRIQFVIPGFSLGHTRENCIYILEETQQLQPLILKLLLERIGENTKTIILGSSGQLYVDSKGRNALRDFKKRFFHSDMSKKYQDIGFYKFPVESIMRDSVVMDVVRAYEDENV